jgi:glyoxylase-like metal-dependent hydrolase (beta-lactamase superfamily II)
MWERLDRRSFVRELSVASFGIAVLGAAACSTSDPEDTSGSPTGPGTRTTGQTIGGPDATGFGASADWHRASLGFVSAYVLVREGVATVVDTGTDDVGPITDALDAGGVGWSAVTDVILTHKHPDHVGGLAKAREGNPGARVHAGAEDIEAIDAADLLAVSDGDMITGLRIIATPGHTPGHVSVLDETGGVLVAGDALNGTDGGVAGANPDFSEEMEAANTSVEILAGFDYDTILFGHGEPVTTDGSVQVQALLD